MLPTQPCCAYNNNFVVQVLWSQNLLVNHQSSERPFQNNSQQRKITTDKLTGTKVNWSWMNELSFEDRENEPSVKRVPIVKTRVLVVDRWKNIIMRQLWVVGRRRRRTTARHKPQQHQSSAPTTTHRVLETFCVVPAAATATAKTLLVIDLDYITVTKRLVFL